MKVVYRLLVVVGVVLVVSAAAWILVSAVSITGEGGRGRQPISDFKNIIPQADIPKLRQSGDNPPRRPPDARDSDSNGND